ncbi:peptide ABC transporter substrate-binding protein [Clostridium sp. OS1-26]|uniref:peptide ABC transporter substrate-binding protein n=1 Tax=Clostridium sp. OS1-26 TaxID=3070681 RepID=UPI0027DF4723|nr:peptide ABC transporter substrate-binding protein [Clostridium sp. OS1-26]WML36024.1 peptide ABC transporter substrate-binding protein [Clostridium sp. OS1-26]
MKKFIISILILSSVFLNGCVEKSVQGNKNVNIKDYIVYNIGKPPKDLLMLTDYNVRQQDLLVNLFEGLVKTDEKGSIIPGLSDSWALSKDETCYTFNIRDDAKWSDGSDITAEDFVIFFSQILNKDLNNKFAEQLYYIFGASEYRHGKKGFNDVAIRAIDKKKLEIRLNYPCNYFLNILAEPIYSLRKINNDMVEWRKNYKEILYTGCFTMQGISNNNEISLVKNDNYWNKNTVRSNKIILSCIDGSEAALAAYQSDKIDIFVDPPISEIKDLISLGKANQVSTYTTDVIVFNLKKEGIIKDINFRKSIATSIDRSYISKEILNDTAKPALTYIPTNISNGLNGQFINKAYFASTLEKDKALEFIKKTKFDKNNEPLKLVYVDTIENKKVCEAISKNLHDNLQLKVECIGYSAEEFNDELSKGDYDMAKVECEGSYDYPLSFLERWTINSKDNIYGYKNIELDNILEKSKMEKEKGKKIELLKSGENILFEDMPMIPLYFSNIVICKKSNIEDIGITKKGNIKLDKVYINLQP